MKAIRGLAISALLLLGVLSLARANTDVDLVIEDINTFLESMEGGSDAAASSRRQLQQTSTGAYPPPPPPTTPGPVSSQGTLTIPMDAATIRATVEDLFKTQAAAQICAFAASQSGLAASRSVATCTIDSWRAGSVVVTFTITFRAGTSQVDANVLVATITSTSACAVFTPQFQNFWGVNCLGVAQPPTPPSPPPSPILCPPPPVRGGYCKDCHKTTPPVTVHNPNLCPPPPVRVSTSSPCIQCQKPRNPPVATPPVATRPPVVCPPPKVSTPNPSPCTTCKKPVDPPVTTPSPANCPPPPTKVNTPSPKPCTTCGKAPKGPACGSKTIWVKTTNKWGKTRWRRTTTKTYCKAGQKCCKVPASWGKKSWGPKCKSGSKAVSRCYSKCPKCWY